MEDFWNRIKAWLTQYAPHLLKELNKGATDKELDLLEEQIQQSLPHDFRAFYKIHNGQDDYGSFVLNCQELLSTDRIYQEWKIWKELLETNTFDQEGSIRKIDAPPALQSVWMHEAWIPFTSNGGGDHYCLDFAPTSSGNKGQIITMVHDDTKRQLLGESFTDWVADYVHKLETGFYVYSEADESIMAWEDL